MADGDEVPPAPGIGPRQVRAEPAVATVQVLLRVLGVDVVDLVGEVGEEAGRVEVLPDHVARIPVDPELRPVDGLQHLLCRPVVIGQFAGVYLGSEPDPALREDVEDGIPPLLEVDPTRLDQVLPCRREHREVLPDRGSGEPDDGLHAEPLRRPRGVLHRLRSALPDALRLAVAPDHVGQHVVVAFVDRVVADGLAREVVGDGEHLEVVLLQDGEPVGDVVVIGGASPDVQVVAPAGDLQAVEAPARRETCDLLEGQVGPLASEEGDRSSHGWRFLSFGG